MRLTFGVLGVYVLVLLLAGSLPVGASDVVHGGALVHASIPHVHAPRGSPSPAGRVARPSLSTEPAINSDAGSSSEVPNTGLTPPVPHGGAGLALPPAGRLFTLLRPWPGALLQPPPDPPPTS